MVSTTGFKQIYHLQMGGHAYPAFAGLYALLVNLAVSVGLTIVFQACGVRRGEDKTLPEDYEADVGPMASNSETAPAATL